jgi:hypothetical protein
LEENQLSGDIPTELGNLISLTNMVLYNNKLSGPIPASFKKLKNLSYIDVSENKLGNLRNEFPLPAQLNTVIIANNHFTFDGIETLAKNTSLKFQYYNQYRLTLHLNNNKFSVYAGGTLSNNTYYWYKDGNLVATMHGDSTFTPTETGGYIVKVKNSIATALTLKSKDTIYFSALKSSNGNDVALNQIEFKNVLSVYPNPAKSLVTVTFDLKGICIVKLIDNSGKILQTKTINTIKDGNKLQLDVSRYAAGIYFINVTDESNKTEILKLNKE